VKRARVLSIEELHVSYGYISAVKGVSLEVHAGEIVVLLGANGAGKSSIIAALLGVARAENGRIIFKGDDITHGSTDKIVSAGMAVVPEGRGVLPLMTIRENLRLGAYHVKGSIDRQLASVFKRFPVLEEFQDRLAGTLSGGEQQMLAIGRALMSAPELLILDEPSLGLAPLLVSEVFQIMTDLRKDGQTILLAEQNVHKALECADRGYVFETGSLVCEGTREELINDERLKQAYLGGTL
jgi:branched-chain amino acid transport system ATP-binding protein